MLRSLLRLLARCRLLVAALLAIGATAEQLHGALHIDDDFSGVALDAVLLPFAGLQLALDVDLRTFAQVLPGDLSDLAEQ
ncbi:hypothetical protein D3C85_1563650 [compost metagenome]